MRTRTLSMVVALLMMVSSAMAQKVKIDCTTGTKKMSVGNVEVISINVHKSNVKEVKKAWAKFMKSHKAKVKNKKEVFADDAIMPSISTNTVDVYAVVEEKSDKEVVLSVAVNLGGIYLSEKTHPDKFNNFKAKLREFSVEQSKDGYAVLVALEAKKLKKQNKELDKLKSENEKLHKTIEDCKKKIAQNEKEQALLEKDIENQKEVHRKVKETSESIK